jgi:hypothetical protein
MDIHISEFEVSYMKRKVAELYEFFSELSHEIATTQFVSGHINDLAHKEYKDIVVINDNRYVVFKKYFIDFLLMIARHIESIFMDLTELPGYTFNDFLIALLNTIIELYDKELSKTSINKLMSTLLRRVSFYQEGVPSKIFI